VLNLVIRFFHGWSSVVPMFYESHETMRQRPGPQRRRSETKVLTFCSAEKSGVAGREFS
jgi:hypothetical protein